MSITRDGLGIFSKWKEILRQVDHGDVFMMRMFGEEIQLAFVVTPFVHEVVQDRTPPLGNHLGSISLSGIPL